MSNLKIEALLSEIMIIRKEWECRLWQEAKEAGSILAEVHPANRRRLIEYMRSEIYIRQGRRCPLCKGVLPKNEIHEDHIIPISYGGGNERSNIQLVHAKCNLKRGNEMIGYVDLYTFIGYMEDQVQNLPDSRLLALMRNTGF
jgi:5-methylcytosine-specific restriction endonuclease McrA